MEPILTLGVGKRAVAPAFSRDRLPRAEGWNFSLTLLLHRYYFTSVRKGTLQVTSRGSKDSPAASKQMLVGRQSELTFISRLLDEAKSGNGTFLGLSGEPGIGKTRLAEAGAAVAQSKGFITFWGQCHDGQYIPPYWPWKEPLRGLLKMLPRPRGEIRQNGIPEGLASIFFEAFRNPDSQQAMPMPVSDQARLLILESATALIRRISERRPLLLIMDNIHCADVPSLQLLEVVASEMRAQNLMIIGTYREPAADSRAEFRPAIGALASKAFFHGICLSGWDQAAISEYLKIRGIAAPPARAPSRGFEPNGGKSSFCR